MFFACFSEESSSEQSGERSRGSYFSLSQPGFPLCVSCLSNHSLFLLSMRRNTDNILEHPTVFLPGLFAVTFLSDIPTVVLEAVGLLAIQVEASHAFLVVAIDLLLTPEGMGLSDQAIDSLWIWYLLISLTLDLAWCVLQLLSQLHSGKLFSHYCTIRQMWVVLGQCWRISVFHLSSGSLCAIYICSEYFTWINFMNVSTQIVVCF